MTSARLARRWSLPVGIGLLIVLASFVAATPHVGAQQPGAATEVKVFVPWLPNGMLNPAVTVTGREMFMGNPNLPSDCQAGSIRTDRPDAWRCGTADPCFAAPFGDRTTVACANQPWANAVVLLTLSRPLPTAQECQAMMNTCPRPLDLSGPPWGVELANGAKCTTFTGTISIVAGFALLYGCDGGGSVAVADRDAPFDTSQPVWRAFYLPRDGTVIGQVGVLVVWR